MYRSGLRGTHLKLASMGSVGLCVVFWMRAAGYDQDERGNAERRALFVGLWAPMLWLMGQSLGELDQSAARPQPGSTHGP
ncbi:hypothetical protein ITI46_17675 [Streptomyces oryzae]|uniref:Uncharacterized protein n=2 Tax=Streptomyces oryzae TaxID=1434886 RepID=A0ABS3XDK0_9ACTN|nr:hypothetical protein [Streptomyces oryzae]